MRAAWTAILGATKYVAAWTRGDRATASKRAYRVATCGQCEYHTKYTVLVTGQKVGFCGSKFVVTGATCGCMVTVDGKPAGKTMIESERCPSGKWE